MSARIREPLALMFSDPATCKLLLVQGLDAVGNPHYEFAQLEASEIAIWAKVVQSVGLGANRRFCCQIVGEIVAAADGADNSAGIDMGSAHSI